MIRRYAFFVGIAGIVVVLALLARAHLLGPPPLGSTEPQRDSSPSAPVEISGIDKVRLERLEAMHSDVSQVPTQTNPGRQGLRVIVTDGHGLPCPNADVYVTAPEFPNLTQAEISPGAAFRLSLRDLLAQYAIKHVTDSAGTCLVDLPQTDVIVRGYFGTLAGSVSVSYETAVADPHVTVRVVPVEDSVISVVNPYGEPLSGVAVGLVVISGEDPLRVHMLRRITDANGAFTIALKPILGKAIPEGGDTVLALAPYLPGCIQHCCLLDPRALAAQYVLRTPALGSMSVRVFRDGLPVDASVMVRALVSERTIGAKKLPLEEPWFSGEKRGIGVTSFDIIAADSQEFEVSISGGAKPITRRVAGPAYPFARVDVGVDLHDAELVVTGCLESQQSLPADWILRFLAANAVRPQTVTTVIDSDGRFSVSGAKRWNESTVVFWSRDGRFVSTPTEVPAAGSAYIADLGRVHVATVATLASLRLVDAASGRTVDPACLEAVATMVTDRGRRVPLLARFNEATHLELLGPPCEQGFIDVGVSSYRYERLDRRCAVGATGDVVLAPAGRVRVSVGHGSSPTEIVLQPGRLTGSASGGHWEWEGVRPGQYTVEMCSQAGIVSLGSVVVRPGEVATLVANR